MKNFLLATTVLVGTAGLAAAEITLTGDARMGIVDDGGAAGAVFSSRARVSFNLAGETDGGLAFGASFRADNAAAECSSAAFTVPGGTVTIPAVTLGQVDAAITAVEAAPLPGEAGYNAALPILLGQTINVAPGAVTVPASVCGGGAVNGMAGTVFISGAFGKLSMGDNDGAAQATVGHVDGVGYTGNGDLNEIAYLTGNNDPSVLYSYTMGAITVNASAGQTTGDERAIGVSYAGEGFTLSLGYEDNGAHDHIVLGGSATLSGVTVKAVYGKSDAVVVGGSQYAVSATYAMDALSATVFTRSDFRDVQYNGVGVGYSLGGGATLAAGYSKADNANGRFDAGVTFSF